MAPKPNGFLLFMRDYKRREERKGRVFRGGLKEVQADPKCNQEWQSMNPEKKAEYNRRAKEYKSAVSKKTGTGESMDSIEREKQEEFEMEQRMNDDIESTIAMAMEFGNLPEVNFYLMHTNWFYTRPLENNEHDYVPAEFAVLELSLREGVTRVYNKLLKAEIECGYKLEAIQISSETHQISWESASGTNDFEAICHNLGEFLKNGNNDRYPPIYTSKKIVPAARAFLRRLTDYGGIPENSFRLYHLETLYAHLRIAASRKDGSIEFFFAQYELTKDTFCYMPGLDCDFHRNLDGTTQYCSLSTVKRWAFTICDSCCEHFDIPLKPGAHIPKKVYGASNGVDKSVAHLADAIDAMSVKSMTGVSKEHRIRVSERNDEEEQQRRNDKSQKVTVINYSTEEGVCDFSLESSPVQEYQIPLRRPNTMSSALMGRQAQETTLDEMNFPSLGLSFGRGNGLVKKPKESRTKPGRGRGTVLS